MESNFFYTVKVWQTSVWLSPVVIVFAGVMGTPDFGIMMIVAFMGMIFSLPSAALFGCSIYLLNGTKFNTLHKRIILSITGIALTILPFLFFPDTAEILKDCKQIVGSYALIIVAGVWFYKLEKVPETEDSETEPEFI